MTKADKLFQEVVLYDRANAMLNNFLNECISDMIAVGIPVQKDKIIKIGLANIKDTHAVCCFKEIDGEINFIIAIKKTMMYHLDDEVVMANVKNSIYHELIHTCAGATSHNEIFMKWSVVCDRELNTHTRRYIEDVFYYNKTKKKGFLYVCPDCGNEYISAKTFVEKIDCELCGKTMEKEL